MKKYTPENITKLEANEVFVFGDNEAFRHGAGAALHAVKNFGAKNGKGGLVGQSYGIPTKDANIRVLSLDRIKEHIATYNAFTKLRPDLTFYTSKIGCGLSGFSPKDIGPLFQVFKWPDNVIFPKEFNVP